MQKRPLSYTLTTPVSSLPSPLLGPGACHHPSLVSPHSVTDPSLYSAHNASPPLVRSTDVLALPYVHPQPSRPKSGPLFGSLTYTLTLCSSVPSSPSAHSHAHTCMQPHTQGLFSTGTQGKGCHSDKRPNPSHVSLQPPSLMEAQTFFLKFYSRMCECAFPSYS